MEKYIFDFEVLEFDVLLGIKKLNTNKYIQIWGTKKIKNFYKSNNNNFWIGWNNEHYDNIILNYIINDKTNEQIYEVSKKLIEENNKKYFFQSPKDLIYFDIMKNLNQFISLKITEAFIGKNISESTIDFNINRPLTEKEKREMEKYNRDDLDQSEYNFNQILKTGFQLRLDFMKEFNLDKKILNCSTAKVAALVLKSKRIPGIEYKTVSPILYDTLLLNNRDILNYYLNEEFKTDKKLNIEILGVEHRIGRGGIHGARKNYYCKECLYFDVSGYYNLIMMKYDLFPRTIPEEGKKLYIQMYHQQLSLKGINDKLRGIYKPILLAVFGAMGNEGTDFYDPQRLYMVTLTGQMFIVDLIEKLEGKIELIQSNTDGVMAKILNNSSEEEIRKIIAEWMNRTGFNIKIDKIYNLWQRDVNNYIYVDSKNKIHTKGEAVKYYGNSGIFDGSPYLSKEPLIIGECIVEYLINNIFPEVYIENHKKDLNKFQYICKKGTFHYLELQTNYKNGEVKIKRLQKINRAFANKNKNETSMIYKIKTSFNKIKKEKISNLPNNVFIYNEEINSEESKIKLINLIDYNYYINRAYERIFDFIGYSNKENEGEKQLSLFDI